MLLGGLWHGAGWNYIVWGAYHGVIVILYHVFDRHSQSDKPRCAPLLSVSVASRMLLMSVLVLIGYVIFRSPSISQSIYMLTHLGVNLSDHSRTFAYDLLFFSLPLVVMEIFQYIKRDLLAVLNLRAWIQATIYAFLIVWILVFGIRDSVEFIYFQF